MKFILFGLLLLVGFATHARPPSDELDLVAASDEYKLYVVKFAGNWFSYRSGNGDSRGTYRQVVFYIQGIGKKADDDRRVITVSDCKSGTINLEQDTTKMAVPRRGTSGEIMLKTSCML